MGGYQRGTEDSGLDRVDEGAREENMSLGLWDALSAEEETEVTDAASARAFSAAVPDVEGVGADEELRMEQIGWQGGAQPSCADGVADAGGFGRGVAEEANMGGAGVSSGLVEGV